MDKESYYISCYFHAYLLTVETLSKLRMSREKRHVLIHTVLPTTLLTFTHTYRCRYQTELTKRLLEVRQNLQIKS